MILHPDRQRSRYRSGRPKIRLARPPAKWAKWALILLVLLVWVDAGLAQSSRAEELARKQAEKASHLERNERSLGERILDHAEELLFRDEGAYSWLGIVYPGGSLAAGGGYQRFYGDTARFDAFGALSLRNYKAVRAELTLPAWEDPRFELVTSLSWLNAPGVDFYGIGNDSKESDRTSFHYTPTSLGLTATIELFNWLSFGGGAEYLDVRASAEVRNSRIEHPTDGGRVDPDVTYAATRALLQVDWRDSPGYSRRGGLYRVEWSAFSDRGAGRFGFRRTELELVQLFPILRENWVLAFRGLVTTTDVSAGAQIPFFMMPALGGPTSLRGYPSWRFRDRHRLLFSGEYRWTPGPLVDMALFVDAGKVTAERADLDLSGLRTNTGIGIRFHGPSFTALRFDLARSREGWTFSVSGEAPF